MNETANDVNKTKRNKTKQICVYGANLLSYLIKAKGAHLKKIKKRSFSFSSANKNLRRFILFAHFLDGFTSELQEQSSLALLMTSVSLCFYFFPPRSLSLSHSFDKTK